MFAGIGVFGAADATSEEALEMELAAAEGLDCGGAGIDLYKAFAMTDRHIVYAIMRTGGLPEQLVGTYERFFEDLSFRNKLGLGVGAPHRKYCALAQGCALSMPMFALILRPWVHRMRTHGVIPRTLADDVRVHANQSGLRGDDHPCTLVARLTGAIDEAFLFMDQMGASISTSKSHLYASCASIRGLLRNR